MNQELPKPLRDVLARQVAGDVHPSSDALTAFVEHTLPHRENQRVTDHLAQCADCRQVVFLASSAMEEPVDEEQEWMAAAAVPRISPALMAKAEAAQITASAAAPVASLRRRWRLRWGWVPAVAAILLVSAVLLRQRSGFVRSASQSSLTLASKGSSPAVTNSQQTPTVAPPPEPEAEPAPRKSLAKSVRAQPTPAQTFDALASTAIQSKTAEDYRSESRAAAPVSNSSPPAPAVLGGPANSAPAAAPVARAFVQSQADRTQAAAARLRSPLEKPEMAMHAVRAVHPQWRITPDGYLERSAASDNWTRALPDQAITFHVVSVVGDDVWAGGSGGALFHSGDAGQNWSQILLGKPPAVETGTIVSIQFRDTLQGVVTTDGGSHWSTSDGGLTWTRQ